MLNLLYYPIQLTKAYRQSIAYLPSLLALGYFILGLMAVVPEDGMVSLPIELEFVRFHDSEDLRTLLSTLITGMISLMVFSFSMVMSVLSQAGGNFSHKLVFGLVTQRHHQWVLGHYLGTILYILMLLMMPGYDDSPGLWRSLHTYLGVLMVIHCLGLFVYFIHKASQSVQVNSVTARLHEATCHSLATLKSHQQSSRFKRISEDGPLPGNCFIVDSRKTGRIQKVDFTKLAQLATQQDAVIHFNFSLEDYCLAGFPILHIEARTRPDSEWAQDVLAQLVYGEGESIEDVHVHGLTQLMEVAVKALSPGVNDPGTARLCVNQLTDLLRRRLEFSPCNALFDDEDKLRVTWNIEGFDSLLYRVITPIMMHGRNDLTIGLSLLKSLKTLSMFADRAQRESLQNHADRVVALLDEAARHELDRRFINDRLASGEHRLSLPSTLHAA